MLKRMNNDMEKRTAEANQYAAHCAHLMEHDRRITPKVFGIAMRRAGAKDLINPYPLRFLYLELLAFTTEADKGVPLLIKEANDGARIKFAAKKYRMTYPKKKEPVFIIDELSTDHAKMLLLPQ